MGKQWGFKSSKEGTFSNDFRSDLAGVLINESALKLMNLENPVGEVITIKRPLFDQHTTSFTIIGVFKDMIKGSPFDPARPSIVFLSDIGLNWLFIKVKPDASASSALSKMEAVFNKILPTVPFDYRFVDQEYDAKFREEERVAEMAAFFTFFAIVISCMGLFGLTMFIIEKRTKEIASAK